MSFEVFFWGVNAAFREADCSQIKMITITIMMIIIVIICFKCVLAVGVIACYVYTHMYMHLSRTPKNKMYLQVVGFTINRAPLGGQKKVGSLRSAVAASCVVYPQMEGFIWGYYPQFNLDEHPCEVCRVSFVTNKL